MTTPVQNHTPTKTGLPSVQSKDSYELQIEATRRKMNEAQLVAIILGLPTDAALTLANMENPIQAL